MKTDNEKSNSAPNTLRASVRTRHVRLHVVQHMKGSRVVIQQLQHLLLCVNS